VANDLSAFNAELWSKALIANLDQINVMIPHTNREYDGQLNNIGDTVNVRTLGSITMNSYTKNSTTVSYEDLVPDKEQMTISDAEYFAFSVEDIEAIQNDINALMKYSGRAAVAVNNKVEAKILSAYSSAHNSNKITNSNAPFTLTSETTSGGSLAVYDALVQARENLAKFNVASPGIWCVVDPATTSLLLKDTKYFIRATDLGDRVVQNGTVDGQVRTRPGFVGRCAGFDIFESNAIPTATVGSPGVDAKYLIYGDDTAINYVAQIRSMETLRLQTKFATAVRGLLLHDVKVFAENSKRLGYILAAA
jgi:hypothetical protein